MGYLIECIPFLSKAVPVRRVPQRGKVVWERTEDQPSWWGKVQRYKKAEAEVWARDNYAVRKSQSHSIRVPLLTCFQTCHCCKKGGAHLLQLPYARCVTCPKVYCSSPNREGSACISVLSFPKEWVCPECRRRFQKTPNVFVPEDQGVFNSDMNVSFSYTL